MATKRNLSEFEKVLNKRFCQSMLTAHYCLHTITRYICVYIFIYKYCGIGNKRGDVMKYELYMQHTTIASPIIKYWTYIHIKAFKIRAHTIFAHAHTFIYWFGLLCHRHMAHEFDTFVNGLFLSLNVVGGLLDHARIYKYLTFISINIQIHAAFLLFVIPSLWLICVCIQSHIWNATNALCTN